MIYNLVLIETENGYRVDTYYTSLKPRPTSLSFKYKENAEQFYKEQKERMMEGEMNHAKNERI